MTTDLTQLLEQSPLWNLTQVSDTSRRKQPPLPLKTGHAALLLACGMFDGYVDSDPPHVVKGTCVKTTETAVSEKTYVDPNTVKVVTRTREAMRLIVRAAYQDGRIETYE